MPYLVSHHGTYWFQIRVPKSLVPRYSTHVRQNLSLTDRSLAQPLAYQLVSHWLTQFACDRATIKDQGPSSPLLQFPQLPMEAFTPEPPPYTKPSTTRNKSRNAVGGAGDPGVHSESGTGKEAPRADATGRAFIIPPALRAVVDFCSYPN